MQQPQPQQVLSHLASQLDGMTPEVRKAASWLLDNPADISISSMREIAAAASVTPNTLMRMARGCGFAGYDDFREPFREYVRRANASFPDRADGLQQRSQSGNLNALYNDMSSSHIANIAETFQASSAAAIKAAADEIINARRVFVLGVGLNHSLARNFSYLADMALDNVVPIPREGSVAIDDIARADQRDVLLAITFKPFRSEVVDTVALARRQQVKVVGISDSAASPVVANSEHSFVINTDTPQFFTSIVAAAALLETLMAFVIAEASPEVVDNIRHFHQRRHDLGIYKGEPVHRGETRRIT
jgi:DNA-binding MurR/RpiR family transcriptional regulator